MSKFIPWEKLSSEQQASYGSSEAYSQHVANINAQLYGGTKNSGAPAGFTAPNPTSPTSSVMVPYYNPTTGQTWTASSGGWTPAKGWVQGNLPSDWTAPIATPANPITSTGNSTVLLQIYRQNQNPVHMEVLQQDKQ